MRLPKLLLLATPLLAALACTLPGHAQIGANAPELRSPLRYRRVLLPVDADEALAKTVLAGKLPKKIEEFERYIELLRPAGSVDPDARALIARGEYRARLEGDQLVDGEALLEVRRVGSREIPLALGDCRLALGDAQWLVQPAEPAVLATNEFGELEVLAARNATLSAPWSLRGESDPFGEVTFHIALPPSASNRLTLDLPVGFQPLVDAGFVEPGKRLAAADGRPEMRQWGVELGAAAEVTLQVVRAKAPDRQLVLVKQVLQYEFSRQQSKLIGELQLTAHNEPLRQIELELAPELEVPTVKMGDEPLAVTEAASGQSRRLIVHFSKPLVGGVDRTLTLEASFPTIIGQPWRLPGVKVNGAAWQEGSATLRVRRPLLLNRLETKGGRQSGQGTLAQNAGQSFDLQFFSPDAEVNLLLEPPPTRLELAIGTTLEVDSVAVDAEVRAEVRAVEGRRFELEFLFPSGWTIEAVSTEPSDALYDYDVVPRGPQPQQIHVRLNSAIAADAMNPLRVKWRAHRRLPAQGNVISIDQLRVGLIPGAIVSRRLLAVPAPAPFRLDGDVRVERLDPLGIPAADQRLLIDGGRGRVVLVDDARADPLQLTLASERPRYSADIEVTAHLETAALAESYRVLVQPESTPVSRLLMHFSEPREESPLWTINGEGETALQAQKAAPAELERLKITGGETWEIQLRRAWRSPFELRAMRRTGGAERRRVALLSAPDAERQTGILTLESTGGAGLAIDNPTLRAVPADNPASDRYTNTRAVFRYEPSLEADVKVAPAGPRDSQPATWAWTRDLSTRFGSLGASSIATYHLQTTGQRQIEIRLPSGALLQQVLVDGREVRTGAVSETNSISVLLPSETRYPTLEIVYRDTDATLPHFVGEVAPSAPELVDVPVLCRKWTLWLPPEYRAQVSPSADLFTADVFGRRLFGPLWRDSGAPFQLFSEQDWSALVDSGVDDQPARTAAAHCLTALGRIHEDIVGAGGPNPSWSQLLQAYDLLSRANAASGMPRLYVDAAALSAAGVGHQTLAPTLDTQDADADPRRKGAVLLQSANLTLLAWPDSLLLTTRSATLPAGARVTATDDGVWIVDSPSAKLMTARPETQHCASIAAWAEGDAALRSPWHVGSSRPFAALAEAGWNAYRVDSNGDRSPHCTVTHPALIGVLSWSLLLVSSALVFVLAARRPVWLALLVGLSACAALMTPEPYTPLATGGFLGALLACGLVAALAPRRRLPSAVVPVVAHTGDTTRTMRVAGALLLALCSWYAFGLTRAAAQPPQAVLPSVPKLYPVVFRVDKEGEPTGGYVYVPPEFWDALTQRAKLVAAPDGAARILRSDYECRLAWGADKTLETESFVAAFDFSVADDMAAPKEISIPLAQNGLDLTTGALLDGRPAEGVRFAKAGDRLLVTVRSPGKHKLELHLRPQNQEAGRITTLQAVLPRVVRSRLRVQLPPDAAGVEVPTALGAVALDETRRELIAELGPTGRLEVVWPTSGGIEPKPADLAVDEMFWLKVRPGAVVVDARYRFRRNGFISEVRLTADPRLKLLPHDPDQPISRILPDHGDVSTYHVELKQPLENEVTLKLSFQLLDVSPIGSLRLPHLHAVADRTVSRRMAVTVYSPLEFDQSGQLPPLDPAIFARDWGDVSSAQPPDLAFRLPVAADPDWSLSTRPKSPRTTVQQAGTFVQLGHGEALLDFQAELETQDGSIFQHRLAVPSDLTVDSLSVDALTIEAGSVVAEEQMAARWSRAADGALTVLLDRRVTGRQRLRLKAHAALQKSPFALPQIELVDALVESSEYHIDRSPDVEVKVSKVSGLEELETSEAQRENSEWRRVADFRRKSPDTPVVCHFNVLPNHPQTICTSIVALRRTGGKWHVENTLRLKVKGGQLDELWLDVSERLVGPLQVEPEAESKEQTVPGQARRRIVIRPRQPITGEATIVLRAPLSAQGNEPVNGAEIIPLEMTELEQFIVVPVQAEAQQFTWQPSGGVQGGVSLPEGEPLPDVGEESAVWRVSAHPYAVALKLSEPLASVPAQVHLADIQFAWSEGGECRGLAAFDLEPAGLTSCVLTLPREYRLVHADVAGLPATLSPLGENRWHLMLGPAQLPQRIEVLFDGKLPLAGSERAIAAPSLEGLSVERTLWTLYPPDGRTLRTDHVDTLENHLQRRYEAVMRLLDRGANVAMEQPQQDVDRWYLPWSRRLLSLRDAIARQPSGAAPLPDREQMDAVEREIEDRLKVRPAVGPSVESRDIWTAVAADAAPVTRCTLTGSGGGKIDVRVTAAPASDWRARFVACVAVAAASLLLLLLALRGPLGDWLVRWPHAVGVLIGLAWWLWLTPSLLGWGIVLISVIAAIRAPWKGRRSVPELVPISSVARRTS